MAEEKKPEEREHANRTLADITDSRQAEEGLQDAARQWETTFNAVTDSVMLLDAEHRILRCNDATVRLLGKEAGEIVGHHCWELVHGTSEPIEGCPIVRMQKTLHRETMSLPLGDRWFEVFVDPILDQAGRLTRSVHIISDITERKRVEEVLRESEDRYKQLFENSPIGIGLASLEGKVISANKVMQEITGYSEDELKKINLADTYENPQERKKLRDALKRQGGVTNYPMRLKRKDGTSYDALLNVNLVQIGGETQFQTTCIDITERKQMEEALRENEERLRTIVETAPSLLMITNGEGRHTYVSPQCEEMMGYTREELQGKVLWWVHEDDAARTREAFDRTFREGVGGSNIEFKAVRKNGEVWYASSSWEPLKDHEGRVFSIVSQTTDTTERKRAEKELRESSIQHATLASVLGRFFLPISLKEIFEESVKVIKDYT